MSVYDDTNRGTDILKTYNGKAPIEPVVFLFMYVSTVSFR